MQKPPSAPHLRTLGVSVSLRNKLRALGVVREGTISDAAVVTLRNILPSVRESQDAYYWPTPRHHYDRREPRTTIAVSLPHDLWVDYTLVAEHILMNAIRLGRYSPQYDALTNTYHAVQPTDWLLRVALREALDSAPESDPLPAYKRAPDTVTDGRLVQVSVPDALLRWAYKQGGNRSAFVRQAVQAQLPVLRERGSVPPKAQLLPEAAKATLPVRMAEPMHAELKIAAQQYGVSMAHLIRACCLMQYAALTRQTKEPT